MSGEGAAETVMDGPNTHHYRTFTRGTTFVVISIDYASGDRHTFHVPAEVVHDIEAALQAEHREPPPDALREALQDVIDRSTPIHSTICAGQDDDAPCICGTAEVMERAYAALQAAPEPPGDALRAGDGGVEAAWEALWADPDMCWETVTVAKAAIARHRPLIEAAIERRTLTRYALRAAGSGEGGLDVERLALCLSRYGLTLDMARYRAEKVAAEYARLSTPDERT